MTNSTFEYRFDYFGDPECRQSYNRLIKKEWDVALEKWDQLGLETTSIKPFSFFLEGDAIANISIAEITLLSKNQEFRAFQVGGAIVDPAFRGQGLARDLIERVFDFYSDDPLSILYAHNGVYQFYEKFGFTTVAESQFTAEISHTLAAKSSSQIRKLDLADSSDFELLGNMVERRDPISNLLGTQGHWPLFMFNVLFNDDICSVSDHIYYLESLDVVVIFTHADDRLKLVDIIGQQIPALADLLPFIALKQNELVEFRFTPDRMDVKYDIYCVNGDRWLLDRQRLYVRGSFPLDIGSDPHLEDHFFYPEMYLL